MVPSFRRDYTTAVKNAIRRTHTFGLTSSEVPSGPEDARVEHQGVGRPRHSGPDTFTGLVRELPPPTKSARNVHNSHSWRKLLSAWRLGVNIAIWGRSPMVTMFTGTDGLACGPRGAP